MAGITVTPFPGFSPVLSPVTSGSGDPGDLLLEEWGDTPFSRLGRLPYYRHEIVSSGNWVIPWIRRDSLAMALAEPVGKKGLVGPAIHEFVERRRNEGLGIVFVPIRPEHCTAFKAAGCRVLLIGRTARLFLPAFSLRGNRFRSLRHSWNRGRRSGLRFELVSKPAECDWMELKEVSDRWLARKRLRELRFGTGWFDPANLAGSRAGLVRNRFGRVEAFVSLIEGYSPDEAALDLMRHLPDAGPGTMDFLLTNLIKSLKSEGKQTVDLGLVPLTGLGRDPRSRLLQRMLRMGRSFYDFEGLYAFKNKFRPRWENRYLAFESAWTLPRMVSALTRPVVP